MTDIKSIVSEQAPNPKYMNVSRRSFLKGALAVGGALALAGCGETQTEVKTVTVTDNKTVTVTDTKTVTVTENKTVTVTETAPTVTPQAPQGVTYPSNIPVTTMSYILPDYVKCTGCKKCMVACAYEHYGVPDLFKSNIRVDLAYIDGGRADLPILCLKCGTYTAAVAPSDKNPTGTPEVYGTLDGDNIPCHAACPPKVAAISKDPVTGAMLIDNDKCTACGNCITACEEKGTGILKFSKDEMSVLGMCDMCKGEPKCVLACPESCLKVYATNRNINNSTYVAKPQELARRVIHMIFGLEVQA